MLDLPNPDPGPLSHARDELADGEATAQLVDWSRGRRIRWWVTATGYDRLQQCVQCEVVYEISEPGGARRVVGETHALRYVFRFELEHLLCRAGFRIAALYGDCDRSPFADGSRAMIVVAEPSGT